MTSQVTLFKLIFKYPLPPWWLPRGHQWSFTLLPLPIIGLHRTVSSFIHFIVCRAELNSFVASQMIPFKNFLIKDFKSA